MEVLAELLWTILQQHPTLLPVVVPRIVQMLLFPVSGKCMEEGGESQIVIMNKGSQKVIMNKGYFGEGATESYYGERVTESYYGEGGHR